jgi:glycosyltransferase involved in cell wall biosynthesis
MTPATVLILLPYPPGRAPSQRFRIEHFIAILEAEGKVVELAPFHDLRSWNTLYKKGKIINKIIGLGRGFIRRYALLFKINKYSTIWVHRETAPLGLPLYGWLLTTVFKKHVIFEFDDAIWMRNVSNSNRFFSFVKPYRNALFMMRHAGCNVCGNQWLFEFARRLNPNAVVIPTVVDTETSHNLVQNQSVPHPSIGWTGSHSTLRYLEDRIALLREVYEQEPFELVVISDIEPQFTFPNLRFIRWNAKEEVSDLLRFHIGLMPLPNEEWAKGKCGLKLIQYMALGIVPVAADVGVNGSIVSHEVNGLLCTTDDDWRQALLKLLRDAAYRQDMAQRCRPTIEAHYSVRSQRDKFLHLFSPKSSEYGTN